MRFNHCFAVNSICAPSRAVIITGEYSHINGVRTERYKLIFFNRIGKWELFDKDPQELKSVDANPKYADTVTFLKAKIQTLRLVLDDHDQFQDVQR